MKRFMILFLLIAIVGVQEGKSRPLILKEQFENLQRVVKKSGDFNKSRRLHKKALKVHSKKDYAQSSELWYEAALADPVWWKPYYNLACVAALTGKKDIAVDFIRLALTVSKSYKSPQLLYYLRIDSDLKNLHGFPPFEKIRDGEAPNSFTGIMNRTLNACGWYSSIRLKKGGLVDGRYGPDKEHGPVCQTLVWRFSGGELILSPTECDTVREKPEGGVILTRVHVGEKRFAKPIELYRFLAKNC